MPFYEYTCTECAASTTILQKISDAPATECPTCHAQALTKQISAAGFRLKGAGWYETDFKSDKKKNLAGEGSDGGTPKVDKPAEKAGDKPAEKPASKPETASTPATPAAAAPAPKKPTPVET